MLKDEVIKFIQELDIPEQRKGLLLQQVDAEGVTDAIMAELRKVLSEMEEKIGKENKGQVTELKTLYHDAQKEMEDADKEFQKEMKKVAQAEEKVFQKASHDIDQVNIAAVRKSLNEE